MATYAITSRYYRTEQTDLETEDGQTIAYLRRRFVPQPETMSLMHAYTVVDGDRLDLIAARELGDPQLFWRIADANRAMRPDALTEEPGRSLRITLPEGIPGP